MVEGKNSCPSLALQLIQIKETILLDFMLQLKDTGSRGVDAIFGFGLLRTQYHSLR